MSTAFVKGKLKAAREAIGKKDYQTALDASSQILEYESDNYNAKVFMGLSLLELGQSERSEQTYRSAIELNPKQALAWQGLSRVYERSQSWDQYVESLFGLVKLFSKSDDATKCAETIQKIVELRRERVLTHSQLSDALSLYLPDSPFYSTLSSLPPPDPTNPIATTTNSSQSAVQNSLPVLEEIVSLLEKDEQETIEQEMKKRRTRLNAGGPEEIKREVGREVYSASKLPVFYNELLNHPNTSDELRRSTESKLLRHKRQFLQALPSSGEKAEIKKQLMTEVQELVNGMVLLQIPDELAWTMFIDEQDAETLEDYGLSHLRQFMQLFPGLPLTRLIQGYLIYSGIPLSEEKDEESESAQPNEDDSDPFDTILDAFSSLQGSIFAHRVLASIYLWDLDYPNAISIAEAGLELVHRSENASGKELPSVKKAFNIILATSLVHLYPPKHHARALRIIDDILQQDPDNAQSLMGKGSILQCSKDWSRADANFSRVLELLPEDKDDVIRAKEEHAWCQVQLGHLEDGAELLKATIDALEGIEGRDEDRARCWWRLGRAYWEMGVDRETAYGHFITSLKCSPTFAPAFTSLGVHYLEAADPPDPSRASKCFQKAFELDAREGDAARRLAEGFAEEREWDLVEVVAKRTIEGEGGLEGTEEGSERVVSGRYLATNAWAWKALGVVELNRRNYSSAIQAFQVALRAQPEDQLSWLRLGEAYSKAGRHVAAVKALTRALELQPDDWICSYLIADVQRQTGEFQEAVDSFEAILQERPEESGVLMSLSQTHLDLGQSELSDGFIARAERSFVTAIRTSLRFLQSGPGFRTVVWKTISDAVYQLSQSTSFFDEADVHRALSEIAPLISLDAGSRVSGILSGPLVSSPVTGSSALRVAVASYNYRISLGLLDNAATGSAWFDLGVALNRFSTTAYEEQRSKASKEAISCFKEALGLDPGNDTYWRALGDAHFVSHPKIAQHAYIKALEINNKAKLGLLYLYHDDTELANEALYKAQTLDPDYTMAWVGQSLVASRNEHHRDSRALLEHAVSLTANAPDADLEFAKREFTRLSEPGSSGAPDELFPAFFILSRYVQKRPDDASGLHLLGLVCAVARAAPRCYQDAPTSVRALSPRLTVRSHLHHTAYSFMPPLHTLSPPHAPAALCCRPSWSRTIWINQSHVHALSDARPTGGS
ncbi:hypothetical protein EWM64_g5681 [Hericium alpestre]|uniref:Superkiller protein 3 n=1 Tax=Hericium alpestre TaxID=135208 RepID=A0A4Y9ZVY7_9AGAM|nr:hypothetical protein EWM64_g5681 [Hericium alpestre]